MSEELIEKLKTALDQNKDKLYLFFQFSLIGALFFGLGIIYEQNSIVAQKSVKIGQNEQILATVSQFASQISEEQGTQSTKTTPPKVQTSGNSGNSEFLFVASKNGSTYYKTSCSNRINEENKIYFKSEEDAQKTGLRRSKTCFK